MSILLTRLPLDVNTHSTVNARTVEVFFQTFPGAGGAAGIAGLDFRVLRADGSVAATGTTTANGRVRVRLNGAETVQLEILGSVYNISALNRALFPRTQLRGVQERLNMLGYNAGDLHADDQAVDLRDTAVPPQMGLNDNARSERAILNFQADNDLFPDAMFGAKSQAKLRAVVSNAGLE